MKRLLILPMMALVLMHQGWAAEPQPDDALQHSSTRITLVPSFADLSPADMAQVNDVLASVRTAQDAVLPLGDRVDADEWEKILAKRAGEVAEFHESMEDFHGGNYKQQSEYQLGDWTFSSQLQQSPRAFTRHRYIGFGNKLDIIQENGNLLEDENKKLRRLADKLQKSKFACGNFDWVLQLKGVFNKAALEKYVDALGESALAAAPMALLANWSPTLYEIVKFFRGVASGELNAEKITCSQMEDAFIDIGRRTFRGPGYAECLKANEGAGISHAHQMCNKDKSSIWDGLENTAGKIVGFVDGLDEPLNITSLISDSIRPESDPGSTDYARNMQEAQDALDEARAQLAAHPMPPGNPPVAGTPESAAWQEAKSKHETWAAEVKRLEDSVGSIAGQINAGSGGLFSNLRSSLADNLPNIIGNWTADASFDIQFGKQPQRAFILKHIKTAETLARNLTELLEQHYALLIDPASSADDLRESRYKLQGYALASMNAPWSELEGNEQSNVRFGFDTMDKLAVLWSKWRYSEEDSVVRQSWPDQYEFVLLINYTTEYEVYAYLAEEAERLKPDVIQAAAEKIKGEAQKTVLPALKEQLDQFIRIVSEERDKVVFKLRETVRSVNAFELPRNMRTNIHKPARSQRVIVDDNVRLGQ